MFYTLVTFNNLLVLAFCTKYKVAKRTLLFASLLWGTSLRPFYLPKFFLKQCLGPCDKVKKGRCKGKSKER